MWGVGNCCSVGNNSREGHGHTFRYSLLENPMDRRAWRATVRRVAELDTTEASEIAYMHLYIHSFLDFLCI